MASHLPYLFYSILALFLTLHPHSWCSLVVPGGPFTSDSLAPTSNFCSNFYQFQAIFSNFKQLLTISDNCKQLQAFSFDSNTPIPTLTQYLYPISTPIPHLHPYFKITPNLILTRIPLGTTLTPISTLSTLHLPIPTLPLPPRSHPPPGTTCPCSAMRWSSVIQTILHSPNRYPNI